MNKLTVLWNIVRPIVSAILGIILSNKYNIFEIFGKLSVDNQINASMTAYFAAIENIFIHSLNYIKNNCVVRVSCIFYLANEKPRVTNTPTISLIESREGFGKIYCQVSIIGNKRRLKDLKIIVEFPEWVDITIRNNTRIASADDNRVCTFDISHMASGYKNQLCENSSSFCIEMLKSVNDEEGSTILSPILKKHRYNIFNLTSFESNKFEIKTY